MARIWTEAQSNAIEALDGSVLVSAAAGSGKTAVLTQRVINRLTDKKSPTSVDRLLIVTFTRAAAQEMKQRISDALSDLLKKDPDNSNLINQQILLPTAKICTIDSFCSDLVKENFQALSLSPDFRIGDEGELQLLSKQAMDMTMEFMYENDSKSSFRNLTELLFSSRDDSKTAEMAEKLYHNSVSFPFPDKWLDEICLEYRENAVFKDSSYGKIIMEHTRKALEYCSELAESILQQCEDYTDLAEIFEDAVNQDKAQINYIIDRINENESYDEIRRSVYAYSSARRKNASADLKEDPVFLGLDQNRKNIKKQFDDLKKLLCCSEEEYAEDMKILGPMIKILAETAKIYRRNFSMLKKEKKIADFSDITHMALELLVRETENGWESTELADSLKDNFDEILIDEYQDTNAAQDMLFTAISRHNLFRVGDVKQSIYRFRQANPDIFISLKESYEPYNKDKNIYPARIVLGNNFRSRKNVTDIINFVFSQIMSKNCGDIDYDENEELVFSAEYYEGADSPSELHLVSYDSESEDELDADEVQARHISAVIKDMIASGYKIKDGDGERTVTYKDFAILMRATGSGRGIRYAEALRDEGIPCFTEVSGEFLTSVEISLALNILRVIDNPKQDIPLLSVLMSPVFGFNADDVAKLRLSDRQGDIYACLLNMKEEPKVKAFLEQINYWRGISVCLRVKELIEEIYSLTALPSIFQALDTSGIKRGNLMLLCDYADIYENSGYGSLSGFISFIDRLGDKKRDISGAISVAKESDCVKIMTIHKSKGLEFPVCILAGCATGFNKSDEKNNLVISQKHGIGVKMRNIDTFEQYDTLCHKAVKLAMGKDNISEEMRVLYVAMTRAREKLIMVYCTKDIEAKCIKYASGIPFWKKSFSPYGVSCASGMGEWLISALLRHPDAGELRDLAGIDDRYVLPTNGSLKVVIADFGERSVESDQEVNDISYDEDFLELIKERSEFTYKYKDLSGIVTKRAASETDKNFVDRDYFASSVPAFLSDKGLTGAARGIATHSFIQYADYEKARISVRDEIERLRDKGILSSAEADSINIKAAETFFSSSLLERILESKLVMREKKFTIEVPVSDVYDGMEKYRDEMIMIQGIADCAFLEDGKLVVVDYKTDRLPHEDMFREKYASQVLIYKKALKLATGYDVKETLLYSFHLGKEIKVEG